MSRTAVHYEFGKLGLLRRSPFSNPRRTRRLKISDTELLVVYNATGGNIAEIARLYDVGYTTAWRRITTILRLPGPRPRAI